MYGSMRRVRGAVSGYGLALSFRTVLVVAKNLPETSEPFPKR